MKTKTVFQPLVLIALAAGGLSAQTPVITGVRSAADFSVYLATDGYISIFGSGLASSEVTSSHPSSYPGELGGTEVLVCTQSPGQNLPSGTCRGLPIQFVSPSQINAVLSGVDEQGGEVSWDGVYYVKVLIGLESNAVDFTILGESAPFLIQVQPYLPSMFLAGSECSSDYQASHVSPCMQVTRSVITDGAGRLINSSNPAVPGTYASVWLTGLGPLGNANAPVYPVWIFGPAVYAGAVPDYEGLYQINFQVPNSSSAAPCGSDVEVNFQVLQGNIDPQLHSFTPEARSGVSSLPVINSGTGCT